MRVATGTHAFLDRRRRSTEFAMREHARYRPPPPRPGPPSDPRHRDSALHRYTHRDDHPRPDRSPPRPGRRVLLSCGTNANATRTMATKPAATATTAVEGREETARSGQEEALSERACRALDEFAGRLHPTLIASARKTMDRIVPALRKCGDLAPHRMSHARAAQTSRATKMPNGDW